MAAIVGPAVSLPDAVQFEKVSSPAEIYFDQSFDRTQKERAEKGEKRIKLRDFMDQAKQTWADMAEDDQMPFIERYKELCMKEGKEFTEPVEKKEKKEKKRKAPADKENSDPSGDKEADATEGADDAKVDEETATEPKAKKTKETKAKTEKKELTEEEKKKKKPPSAYFIYSAEVREKGELAKANPEAKMTDLAKLMGAAWKEMSEEEKAPYNEQANELKRKWCEDNPELAAEQAAKKAKTEKKELTEEEKKKKKPLSAYFIYTAEVREKGELAKANPEAKMTELTKLMGAAWKEMSEEDKATYYEQANELRRKWNLDNGRDENEGIKVPGEEAEDKKEKKVVEKKEKKEAAPKKPPKDVIQLFINGEFKKEHKESNPDAKPKELREAGEAAWKDVSEEAKAEWQAKYDALVEAYPQQDVKPVKPSKPKIPQWKDLHKEFVMNKWRESNADGTEEDGQKHVESKVKTMSKAEKMRFQDDAKDKKKKLEKEYEAAVAQWEVDAAEWEAAQAAKKAEEVEDGADAAEAAAEPTEA